MRQRCLGAAGSPKQFNRRRKLITSFADLGTSRSVVDAGAVRWSCARCEVSVGRLDGAATELPTTWTRDGDSAFCLTCSRALAGEAALDAAPAACSREERFVLQRDAVIRFELGRTPLAADRIIAHACRTSPRKVASVRASLADVASPQPTAPNGA